MVGLSDVLSVVAVIVSVTTFSIGYMRSKKSERIRVSRDLWESIRTQNRIIDEWSSKMDANPPELTKALDSLKSDLGYFVYLIEKGEIKESSILDATKYYIPIDTTESSNQTINATYGSSNGIEA